MKKHNSKLFTFFFFFTIVLVAIVTYFLHLKSGQQSYDLIYSFTCHENPDTFVDTLNNLFYFNQANKIAVVVNCNHFMFQELPRYLENNENNKNIFINNVYFEKERCTFSVLKGHHENLKYCERNNLSSALFIPLASNCLMKKQITKYDLQKQLDAIPAFKHTNEVKDDWYWGDIQKNQKINNILFHGLGVKGLIKEQHEGMIIPFDVMKRVSDFLDKNQIESLVEQETVFEEYLLITLVTHYYGKKVTCMCKVYFDFSDYPPMDLLENQDEPCFKRISRNYNDERRIMFREKNNFYKK